MRGNDVVVVGAGIAGLSCARALAKAGARVLIIESARVGAGASSEAAGILSAQAETEMDPPLFELALRAREHHRALAPALEQETGLPVDYSSRGLLYAALSDEDEPFLDDLLNHQHKLGQKAEKLARDEVLQAEPNLNTDVRGAVFLADDHRVNSVRLVRALAASAVAHGAGLLTGRPVSGLVVERGRVSGLRAGQETFPAPVVVNATGAWAGRLPGDPLPPPVEPIRGQIVAFETAPPLLHHVVFTRRGYLVPHADGRVLAGSTSERAGFDKSVTAGGLKTVLSLALEVVPSLGDVRVADSWAGLRPGTPDGRPVLGEGGLPGLLHAAGLYRHGILLGPLVGELVAELALGRSPSIDLEPFSLARFSAAGAC